MIFKSYAKINLSLKIKKKLKKDNLHDISSHFCLINLYDVIQIKKFSGKKDLIKFKGKFGNYVKNSKNSIKTILSILRKKKVISRYYNIVIQKNIPVFAGLGGGTSNAAFLLRHLIKDKIDQNLLKICSKNIGSDFKLFFHNQGFMKSLNKIIPLKKRKKLFFLLVYPNIKCSTKNIYSRVKTNTINQKIKFREQVIADRYLKSIANENNDLQLIVEKKYLQVRKLIKEIQQIKGCYFSRLTGSGSVCYGVFKNKDEANKALTQVKIKYPKYWSSFAKTI